MKKLIYLSLLLFTLTSCEEKSKKIVHDNTIETVLKKDSTKIEIANLPILIDSTDYLIHPIGYITEYGSRSSIYSNSSSGYTSFSVARVNDYTISGELTNIKIQHIDSQELKPLTNKIIKITSVTFLKNIAKKTGLEFLVYNIYDRDTNQDLILNYEDVETLYISSMNGNNFKKLTPDLEQLVDWKIVPQLNRLYFKSISDINKNGIFDKTDNINYQYIDLEDPNLKIITYNPI